MTAVRQQGGWEHGIGHGGTQGDRKARHVAGEDVDRAGTPHLPRGEVGVEGLAQPSETAPCERLVPAQRRSLGTSQFGQQAAARGPGDAPVPGPGPHVGNEAPLERDDGPVGPRGP
jgi:hypothetical protein